MKFHFIFLLSIFFTNLFSQTYKAEKFEKVVLKAPNGAVIVYNGTEHSFHVTVLADSILFVEHPDVMIVDNVAFQSLTFPFQQPLNYTTLTQEDEKELLLGYMKYEMDYLKEMMKETNLNEVYEFMEINGKQFLFWTYDMPKVKPDKNAKNTKSIEQQHYLVAICFDQVVGLNMAVDERKNAKVLRNRLISFAETLKLYNEPTNLEELYNELKKGQ